MAVSAQGIYQDIASELGMGLASPTLKDKCVRAINRAMRQLEVSSDGLYSHTDLTDIDTSTTINIDAKWEYLVYAGTMFWMIRAGHRSSDPKIAPVQARDARLDWEDARGDFLATEYNDSQADEDNDVAHDGSVV